MNTLQRSLLLTAASLASSITHAQYDTKNLAPTMDAGLEQRFGCTKLRLYPIVANETFRTAHNDIGQAVPLNKALQDGRLKIEEQAGGAEVNTLQAVNTSSDTIYMMQGEVIVGGQQDRMLAQDVLIPPGARMDIAAFCVEHGRWSENGSGSKFTSTIGFAAQDVRKAAAVEKEQTMVWEKVADNMKASEAASPSGSYADMMEDAEFQADRARYRDKLKDLPASCIGMVGVVAVSGDKVIGCDVFATEALFKQAYPQLIDAYIAEALNKGGDVTLSPEQVKAYFDAQFADEAEMEKKAIGNGSLFKAKGHTYRVSMF